MIRKSRGLAAALVLTAGLAAPAFAQNQAAQPPRPRCNNLRAIARVVQLTPDQLNAARGIYDELRQTVEPLREQIPPLRDALEALLDTANPVAADVGQTVIDIDALHDQIEDARTAADDEFEALLTTEQLARYQAFLDNCRQGFQFGG